MTDSTSEQKNPENSTSDAEDFTTQKYKWEQQKFLEALKAKDYDGAMAIMESTIRSPEARRKWWDRPESKPHLFEYMKWLRQCRQQAGAKDWRMWQTVFDEMRFMLDYDRMDQKMDITSGGQTIEKVTIVDLGNFDANKQATESSSGSDTKQK